MKFILTILTALTTFVICSADDGLRESSELLRPLPIITGRYTTHFASRQQQSGDKVFLDMSEEVSSRDDISMRKAMLLSLLLPGAGQYYAGSKLKGQVFMGAELAIWSGFIAYRVYGGWKKNEYKNYASAYAGVDNSGKDEQFYDWVGFYESRDEFNLLGRLYYPDRPYLPDTREYYWQWESQEERLFFKDLKDASKRAFRNSTFMLGLALLNRVVAGIDTYRTVKSARKVLKSLSQIGEYKVKISTRFSTENPSLKVTLSRKF